MREETREMLSNAIGLMEYEGYDVRESKAHEATDRDGKDVGVVELTFTTELRENEHKVDTDLE